jgi:DNA gyrase inhibitor GyrI
MTATDLLEQTEVDVHSVPGAQFTMSCASDPAAISAAMQAGFATLMPYIAINNLMPAGPPRAIYSAFDKTQTRFTLAMPVASTAGANPSTGITLGMLPGGRMHRFTHRGPYTELSQTYEAITSWMRNTGLMRDAADWMKYSPMWEEYVTDPAITPASELITYIYVPVRA